MTRGEGAARDEPYRLYNLDVFEYDVTPDRAHQARGMVGAWLRNGWVGA